MPQRDDTQFQPHLYAALNTLIDNAAYQESHDTLALVILNNLYNILCLIRLAEYDSYARDIARYQRYAERTDDGIGNKTDTGFILVRILALYILQRFQDLSSNSGGKTCVQSFSQIFLIRDQAL